MKFIKKLSVYPSVAALAALSALNCVIFVFPNRFAPSGVSGIATMIQDLSGINIGYFSLLINIPLILLAFFHLNRDFAIKSSIYIVAFSVASILLKRMDLSLFCFKTDTGLSAIVAGVIDGIHYVFLLSRNGSSGGVDIIAATVKKKRPYLDFMSINFSVNFLIAFASYFVYGMRWEPVILCILYCFVRSTVTSQIRDKSRRSVKYEIITSDAEQLCGKIAKYLNRTAIVMNARGAYSGSEKKMVVCVVDRHSTPRLEELILSIPTAVVFKSEVDSGVTGIEYK